MLLYFFIFSTVTSKIYIYLVSFIKFFISIFLYIVIFYSKTALKPNSKAIGIYSKPKFI